MGKKAAYVITVGTEPGVYTTWLDVQYRIRDVPGAAQQGFDDYQEAVNYYAGAAARGETKRVVRAPSLHSGKQPCQERLEQPPCYKPQSQPSFPSPEQLQKPAAGGKRIGRFATTGSIQVGGRTAEGTAERDAIIRKTLQECEREKEWVKNANKSSNGSRNAVVRRTKTEPAPRPGGGAGAGQSSARVAAPERSVLQRAVVVPPAQANASVVRTSRQAIARPNPQRAPNIRATQPPSAVTASVSSDLPTCVTQDKNDFFYPTMSDVPVHSPRYAQSLSYASSPSVAAAGVRSPAIAASDCKSHLSTPSSFGTRYFPEDWPARQRQMRESPRERLEDTWRSRSPLSDSEYATAPNTPEAQVAVLADVITSSLARRDEGVNSARVPFATFTPPTPPPETPSTRRSNMSPRSNATESSRKASPGKKTPVVKSLSDVQVQTEPQVRRRKHSEAAVQTSPRLIPMKKRYVNGEVQTSRCSPSLSSLRTSAGTGRSGDMQSDGACCGHHAVVCRNCGQPARIMRSVANAQSVSSWISSVAAAGSSRTSPVSSASSAFPVPVPDVSQSAGSPAALGRHTPLLGASEIRTDMQPSASIVQTAVDSMRFVQGAEGTDTVVHDMRFDPRSPIHRGTAVPSGSSVALERPSPAMLPLNSLLFGS